MTERPAHPRTGELVIVVEASDQSLWTRSHAGKLGVVLGLSRDGRLHRVLVEGREISLHRLDMKEVIDEKG